MGVNETPIGPFLGITTTTDGEVQAPYASDLLNVRVDGGIIRARRGFRLASPAPSGGATILGLGYASGYDDAYLNHEELVALYPTGPVTIDLASGVRTQIQAVDLANSLWTSACFDAYQYWVNPDSTPNTVFRHKIGDASDWAAVGNTPYVAAPSTGGITLNPLAYPTRPWTSADTVVVNNTGNGFKGPNQTYTNPSSGTVDDSLYVTGSSDDDNGVNGQATVTITYTATEDYSAYDTIAVAIKGGAIFSSFKSGGSAQVKIGGSWVTPEHHEFLSTGSDQWTFVMRLKGVTGTNAVQGIKFTVKSHPVRFSKGLAFTVLPLVLGGSYLEATATGHRLWDGKLDGDGITYGVRYTTVGGTPQVSAIQALGLPVERVRGSQAGPSCYLGARVEIDAGDMTQSPWVEDDAGTAVRVQFLRLVGSTDTTDVTTTSLVWKILGDAPNAPGASWIDTKEEWELATLTTASGTAFSPSAPETTYFSDVGMVGCFPHKGSMVWLRKGGSDNLCFSRIGAAIQLANDGDQDDDTAAGATFTLSDDRADEPQAGVSIGDAVVIFARRGTHASVGSAPLQMTPPRRIVGAPPIAGRLAYASMPYAGVEGAAYVDAQGEGVWWVGGASVFQQDTGTRPTELTLRQRGLLRSFLLSQDGVSLADIRAAYDESTDSLWVVLGSRAMVLRPESPVDGQRQWVLHEYAQSTDGGTDPGGGGGGGGGTIPPNGPPGDGGPGNGNPTPGPGAPTTYNPAWVKLHAIGDWSNEHQPSRHVETLSGDLAGGDSWPLGSLGYGESANIGSVFNGRFWCTWEPIVASGDPIPQPPSAIVLKVETDAYTDFGNGSGFIAQYGDGDVDAVITNGKADSSHITVDPSFPYGSNGALSGHDALSHGKVYVHLGMGSNGVSAPYLVQGSAHWHKCYVNMAYCSIAATVSATATVMRSDISYTDGTGQPAFLPFN